MNRYEKALMNIFLTISDKQIFNAQKAQIFIPLKLHTQFIYRIPKMNSLAPTLNKQLQRQLKNTISNYKAPELKHFLERFKQQLNEIEFNQQFKRKGINCIECIISVGTFTSTGFGRGQIDAEANSIRNLIDMIIAQNYYLQQIKQALKLRKDRKIESSFIDQLKNDETLDLNPLQFSVIEVDKEKAKGKQAGCKCIYFQVHQHHKKQISNLEARIALLNKENMVLKQILLQNSQKKYNDKQNDINMSNIVRNSQKA